MTNDPEVDNDININKKTSDSNDDDRNINRKSIDWYEE